VPPGGAVYTFANFELDGRARQLRRNGERVALSDRYLGVLLHLAAHAGEVISKDDLVTAGWGDTAVGDNSLEQAISALRRALGTNPQGDPYLATVPRQGYRLAATVTRTLSQATHEDIDALLAPHRALLDGRRALESLEREQILRARTVFTQAVAATPDTASAHVGLAYACVLQFEMTRTDEVPDTEALRLAATHAYEACRLDTENAEAWSTLGFILERIGKRTDAVAAGRRAIALEPDNWRHHFRLASTAWGEERLRAARRTLALVPGFALAHWLAATVMVARGMLDEATRELAAGVAAQGRGGADSAFSGVALHWLLGLIHLSRQDGTGALAEFDRELANEPTGHLYSRECCANTWYAIGAWHLRHARMADAVAAFDRALQRVPKHALAQLGRAVAGGTTPPPAGTTLRPASGSMDEAVYIAAGHVIAGSHDAAARVVDKALSAAPTSNAAWVLPVEPLLNVGAAPEAWAPPLARLRARAI
jgi:DNA-binding winged helix-turn-helix (wHTH) protein